MRGRRRSVRLQPRRRHPGRHLAPASRSSRASPSSRPARSCTPRAARRRRGARGRDRDQGPPRSLRRHPRRAGRARRWWPACWRTTCCATARRTRTHPARPGCRGTSAARVPGIFSYRKSRVGTLMPAAEPQVGDEDVAHAAARRRRARGPGRRRASPRRRGRCGRGKRPRRSPTCASRPEGRSAARRRRGSRRPPAAPGRGRRSCWRTAPAGAASNTPGQMIRLAMPVSSSIVMNITPLAEPGFCRTSTMPGTTTRRPSRMSAEVGAARPCPARAQVRRAGTRPGAGAGVRPTLR